jgi:hypothetical protein
VQGVLSQLDDRTADQRREIGDQRSDVRER